jgi:hypothetical protein
LFQVGEEVGPLSSEGVRPDGRHLYVEIRRNLYNRY